MQGTYTFYFRGEKASLDQILCVLDSGYDPRSPRALQNGSTLKVPAGFLQAPADARLHIAVEQQNSVNLNGVMEEAKSLHKRFPHVEMLYLETHLNNECFANVLYGPAGDPECKETDTIRGGDSFPIDYEEGTVTFTDEGEEEVLHFDPDAADLEEAIYDLLVDWCDRHGASPFVYQLNDDTIGSNTGPWILKEPMASLADTDALHRLF